MSDFPSSPVLPLFVGSVGRYTALWESRWLTNANLNLTNAVWPVANQAVYLPFWLPFAYPVRRLWWQNGNVAGNNWDIGIYSASGARLISAGSTAAGSNAAPSYVAASILLPPGRYYLGVVHSSVNASRAYGTTAPTVGVLRQVGVLQEASALPLPATMTPAVITATLVPHAGFTRTPSGF